MRSHAVSLFSRLQHVLRNYVLIALRNPRRQPGYAAITAIGLMGVIAAASIVATPCTQGREAEVATRPVVQHGKMSAARATHQATLLETGEVLITGGCAGASCRPFVASAEVYDPATGSFRSVSPMAEARGGHAAVALEDGGVLIAGGWSGQQATASAEVYDPAQGRFTSLGGMTTARAGAVAARLPDGRVLIAGGQGMGTARLASAEVFDPATYEFLAVGSMHTPRASHAIVALTDGRVLITGGNAVRRGETLRSAELFDATTGTFEATGDMTTSRHKHASVLLPDGRVLIIGGSDRSDSRGRYASTEIYDPTTGVFSAGPNMHEARYKIPDAVAVLPSGAVLVVGDASRPELWDPAEERFRYLDGRLDSVQAFATAILLPTGAVLVLGGYDEQIRPSATAWLVQP